MVQIYLQLIGGTRIAVDLETSVTVADLQRAVETGVGRPPGSFKLVFKGMTLPDEDPQAPVKLSEGDAVLVMPRRKTPAAHIVDAALSAKEHRRPQQEGEGGDDDDDDDEPAQLPAHAWAWERTLVEWLRARGQARAGSGGGGGAAARRVADLRLPPWVIDGLVLVRPVRLVALMLFMVGCLLSSRAGLGPLFVIAAIVATIFTNLGTRREGDTTFSAYSLFNPGVARLPGQLDADEVDRQMRRGQL